MAEAQVLGLRSFLTAKANDKIIPLILLGASLIFFMYDLHIQGIEYRDDEIFYVKSTQEMLTTKNFFSPIYFGEHRFQKPILFYWFILVSYQILGVNWFAARFVSVIAATCVVYLTWLLAKELFDRTAGLLSAVIVATIPLFFRHARNAVPDMALNLFVVFAIYCGWKFMRNPSNRFNSVLFFISCALGFMIKGFAALAVPFLTIVIYACLIRKAPLLKAMNFPLGIMISLVIVLPWFLYMTHLYGNTYIDYMLKTETLNRMIAQNNDNLMVRLLITFKTNSLFYLGVLVSYFSPWTVFFVMSFFWAIVSLVKNRDKKDWSDSLLLMVVWFCVVFLFFSVVFAKINHLILVLTVPFAILTSRFFLENFDNRHILGKIVVFARKYLVLFIVGLGLLGIVFLQYFFLNQTEGWLLFFSGFMLLVIFLILRSRENFLPPLLLGITLMFVFSQSMLLSKARLTAHSSLQDFAQIINKDLDDKSIIGVGSHDLHEKEFQVYFDRKIEKVATSVDEETKMGLVRLLQSDKKVFCLITRKDYETFLKGVPIGPLEIVKEDFIFRKRLHLDRGFFVAVVHGDREKVRDYLLEKIVLIRKGHNA